MKKYRALSWLIIIALLLQSFVLFAAAEGTTDTTVTAGSHSIDAAVPYLGAAKITDNVQGAILYECNSDTLMHAYNVDNKTFPSSLVKIMTALMAVESGELDAEVTVTESALASVPYYAASAKLQAGEVITLDNLLYCMMVGSANDAAAVIAEHISGSQSAFVEAMNNRAQELGCTATQFTNVHGLHDEEQYTTVRDLARILRAAMDNENFVTYFSAVSHIVPATSKSDERELSTGNHLMSTNSLEIYFDERVTGGRTGIADDGTRCLASSAENNGMKLICIVVGSESVFAEDGNTQAYGSFKETSTLLDAGFNGYRVAQVLYKDQALAQVPVTNGNNDVVLSSDSAVYCVLPEGVTVDQLRYQYTANNTFTAPVKRGDVLSQVQVWNGNSCVAQADMVAMHDVPVITAVQIDDADNASVFGNVLLTIFLILAGCVAAGALVLFGVKYFRVVKVKFRRKRHRRDRRRTQ